MKRFIRKFKNSDIYGIGYTYFDDRKPNRELISEYIHKNLVYDSHNFPLGTYPAVKLMKVYEILRQRSDHFANLDGMLGFFQKGDKWKLFYDHGKRKWVVKIKIRNLPLKEELIDIYCNLYTPRSKKMLKPHFESDILIFEEFLNESARRASLYLNLNKESFY